MDGAALSVLIGGAGAIGFVLVYFFGPRRQVRTLPKSGGVQEIRIVVKGGYSPDVIVVEKDRPVRLNFYREETAACSEQVVLGDFGIARTLPAFATTPVEFTPDKSGEFTFTCGMNMLHGKLIVKDSI